MMCLMKQKAQHWLIIFRSVNARVRQEPASSCVCSKERRCGGGERSAVWFQEA